LTDPVKDIRYVKDPVPLTVKPLFTRVWYALCLLFNARLIGTSAQVAHVPPPFRGSRSQFLWDRLKKLVATLVLLDTSEYFVGICVHLYVPEEAAVHTPSGYRGYLVRCASTAVWLLMTYSSLKYAYLLMSIFAVATGLGNGNPEDWPDAFGEWSRAYTLRNLWGRAWHQLFRRHFAQIGKIAVRILRVPRNTWLSSQVQIHAAFATSALLHSMGDLVLNPAAFGRSSPFFVLNALAITAEDTIGAIARRAGIPRATDSFALRILGYTWVTLWILNTVPLYLSWVYANEFGGYSSLPYSPVREVVVPFM
ncbi:membrane bound O-acyl transferase family-domain-containing protein, partial [Trametes elegans]